MQNQNPTWGRGALHFQNGSLRRLQIKYSVRAVCVCVSKITRDKTKRLDAHARTQTLYTPTATNQRTKLVGGGRLPGVGGGMMKKQTFSLSIDHSSLFAFQHFQQHLTCSPLRVVDHQLRLLLTTIVTTITSKHDGDEQHSLTHTGSKHTKTARKRGDDQQNDYLRSGFFATRRALQRMESLR